MRSSASICQNRKSELLFRRYSREQRDEPFQHGGMGEDSIAQGGVGQSCQHRDLDGGHDFSSLHSEHGEAKNAIAFGIDERLQKTASLGQRPGAQNRNQRDFRQPIGDQNLVFSRGSFFADTPTPARRYGGPFWLRLRCVPTYAFLKGRKEMVPPTW
jgi:hypothetical protein